MWTNLFRELQNTPSVLNSRPSTSCCSLHKNSTMWSLKVWAGICLCFHLQFPPGLWMNNRQAPETGPHPPQPTNRWLSSSPNVFTVHTLLCCGQRAHAARRYVRKYGERDSAGVVHSRGSTYYEVQELCWQISLHFLSLKHENVSWIIAADDWFRAFISPSPLGSRASFTEQLCY